MASKRKTPWKRIDPKTQKILKVALDHVNSVPYKVSLRWLFYRLYQEGFYKTKEDYDKLDYICSRARHTNWNGWRPDTLADETREAIHRVYGMADIEEALAEMPDSLAGDIDLSIDHFYRQDRYVELWYEARAMTGQFRHHTEKVNLVPMGGQPSIPYKWDIAKGLDWKRTKYEKPIVILYFGDEDLSGHEIKADVEEDVRKWSSASFEVVWCGLTEKQAEKYGVPHSYEKKGYQWEALNDEAASEIIRTSLAQHIDSSIIEETGRESADQEDYWSEIILKIVSEAIEKERNASD